MDVDTRVLRYFVAVAEHLSFTRAARTLFVSQPSLSRQIRQLEDRLGTELFVRTKNEVRLTRTGEVLLPAARRQLADWEGITRIVRTTAAAEHHVLRVGFTATGGGAPSRRARAAFLARHPNATVRPQRFDRGGEPDALRAGLVDVAFLWLPADLTGLHTTVVAAEPRMVAMSPSHPLASRPGLTPTDLLTEPIVWTRRAPVAWLEPPGPDDRPPVRGTEHDTVAEMLDRAATGNAVCLGPASLADHHPHPELVWRPVTGADPLHLVVAWPHTTANPLVSAFVQTVRALFR